MDPSGISMGVGAGLGLLNAIANKTKQDQEKKAREQEILLSPWTHMKYEDMVKPRDTSPIADVANGALGGFSQGQNIQAKQNQDALNNAKSSYWFKMAGLNPDGSTPIPGAPVAPTPAGQ